MTTLRQKIVSLKAATGASCADIAETLGLGAERRGVVVGHLWRHAKGIPERVFDKDRFLCGCPKTEENTYIIPSSGKRTCLEHKRQHSRERARKRRNEKHEATRALVERYIREA
jgi:hypothetical protein